MRTRALVTCSLRQAAIILAISLRNGIHQSVSDAEIRKAHRRDDGNQHHPDAVALRTKIAICQRNRNEGREQPNRLGLPAAIVVSPARRSRSFERPPSVAVSNGRRRNKDNMRVIC